MQIVHFTTCLICVAMRKLPMKIKDRLHLSYNLVSLTVLCVTGLIILIATQNRISRSLYAELERTNVLVYKMVENVFDLNRKILLNNLDFFYTQIDSVELDENKLINSDAEHYITRLTDYITIPSLLINNTSIFGDTAFVDKVSAMTGGNVSFLQLVPQGLLQVATNIRRADGSRSTQLYYPNDTRVVNAIREGKEYVDKTFEMGLWHIVAYRPLIVDGKIIGAIHVGIQPDIETLRKHILDIRIGETGIPYIVDNEGILVISSVNENENVYHLSHIKTMITEEADGILTWVEQKNEGKTGKKIIVSYKYLEQMQWIVAVGTYIDEFYGELSIISKIIIFSVISALITIIYVSFRIADKLARPIKQLTNCMVDVREIKYNFSNFAQVDKICEQLKGIKASEDEIQVLTSTFYRMLQELENAHRELISKHRRYREAALVKKVEEILLPDYEKLLDENKVQEEQSREETVGEYFDSSTGPGGQTWYIVGQGGEPRESATLLMMLAQSFISSVFKELPDATPIEAVSMLNEYLSRLSPDKASSLQSASLIVSDGNGWFQYAGPHTALTIYGQDGANWETVVPRALDSNNTIYGNNRTALFQMKKGSVFVLNKVILDSEASEQKSTISNEKTGDSLFNSQYVRIMHENRNANLATLCNLFRELAEKESFRGFSPVFLLRRLRP